MLLLVTIFLYGMLLDVESVSNEVFKDAVRGAAFLFVTVLLLKLRNISELGVLKEIVEHFRLIVLISGVIGASIGLLKYWMTKLGYQINFFKNSLGDYPWGTSLVTDYNFYGLSLLIAFLVSIQFWRQSVSTKYSLLYGCIAGITLNASILSGSRRIFFFVVFLLLLLCLWFLFKGFETFKKLKWKELFAALLITTSVIHGVLYASYVGCDRRAESRGTATASNQLYARLERLIDEPINMTSPRVDRWIYAFQIIKPSELLSGSGFSYRKVFGCKFDACKSEDHPHAPILSALLYGGVLGFLIVAGAFFYALQTARKILSDHSSYADIALGLIATTMFVSISGDSILSMPVFLSMFLISRCVVGLK